MFSFTTENEFSSGNVSMRVNEGKAEGRNESRWRTKIVKERSSHIFIILKLHYTFII